MADTPSIAGLDRRRLLAGAAAVCAAPARAADPDALRRVAQLAQGMPQLRSLVVVERGEIVLARAYRGPALDAPVSVKSVSKTVLAALVGCALDRGVFDGLDQPVAPLLRDKLPKTPDPRLARVTVGDLLTMRGGQRSVSGRGYVPWVSTGDWAAAALAQPFVAEPGTRWTYSTGSSHILGVAMARAAGRDLQALAQAWLGDPLGVAFPPWTRDPTGDYLGGNDMRVSPLGLARFGEMMRRGGVWGWRRVLPAAWVRESWRPRALSTGSRHAYGYGWFLADADGREVSFARGYGGQMVYVCPTLRLTAVATSDANLPGRLRGHVGRLNDLFAQHITAAVAS